IKRAKELMEQLQILDLCDCMPGELSGGEQRRASIVRGILHEPKVIMADEPTGDLDSENTKIVLQMLSREADRGAVVLLVTHEKEAAVFADVQYDMESGRLK
ncbi:MAG: ATP-binding cassette domain-containing protein, partial [Eubacteriales bacterium]|nr:ATP-binding cassette domain-containing protein [Eubacteriales bacterium]